jgi:hypothetical protein
MSMTPAELADERRRGRLAGPAAIAAGILLPAGLVWWLAITADRPERDDKELLFVDHHATGLLLAGGVRSVALLFLAPAAVHLYRATRARKPDLNRIVLVTAVVGTIVFAIGNLVYNIAYVAAAADFAGGQSHDLQTAKDLLDDPAQIVPSAVTSAGGLALAAWFVIGSLNAMRVGLLTRFMGILGVVIGPGLLILPPIPFVMTFWLIAVGLIFLRRWPGNLPPAWESGEAIPWPKPGETDDAATPEPIATPNGEVNPVGPGVRKAEEEAGAASGQPRRKRKRRR